MQAAQVQSLVRGLRSHMPRGRAKRLKKKKKGQCLTVREDPVNGGISGSSEEGVLRQNGFAVTLRSFYR